VQTDAGLAGQHDAAVLAILDWPDAGRHRGGGSPETDSSLDLVPQKPRRRGMSIVLQTHELSKRFGGLTATNNVSISVERGARQALIGPNGAGKTTLINLLTGVLTPSAGRIMLNGKDITRMPVHQRVKSGLVRTFQINQLFADLT